MDVPLAHRACLRFGTHLVLAVLLVLIALLAASPASGATPKLVVRGAAVEGSALTVKAPKGAKLSWLRCTATGAKCRAIKGAKRAGYVLTTADVGSTVRAATGAGTRQIRSKQSIRVRPKVPIATVWPTVSGSGVVGSALTATTGTWAPAGRTYAYQYKWLRCSSTACTAIPGAVGSSYVPTNADSGFAIRVEVTALTSLRTLRGVSNSGVARSAVGVTPFDASVVNTKAPAILGTAKEGAQLQATLGEWSALGLPVTTRVAWTRCLATCTSIAGADALTYVATAADVGSRLRVDVTGTAGPSSATVSSSMSATVAVAAPTNVTAPALSATGTPGIGDSISVTNGTWNTFAPTSFSHQWQRCTPPGTSSCTDIPGATSTPYVTVAADADSTLRARVTITHLTASAISTSGVTLTVTGAGPTSTAAPTISGQVIDGATLTTSGGTFAGPGFITTAGQWRRCDGAGASCADIAGATASTYVLGGADVGSTIIHAVTGTNAWGSATRASAATAVVATADPANVTLPSIAGTLYDTGSATATTGTWSGLTPMAFTHQWRRCDAGGGSCTNIAGATSATHAVTGADVGSTLRVVVTATNAAHPATDISATSAASGQVGASPAPALVTVPTVTGIVEDGATLTWHAGTYTGQLPISFTRQWQRCDASGSSCVNIAGATAATYATTAADVGNTLRVQEQATNSFGSTPLAASSVTSAVAPVVPANGSLPTVTGTKVDGATLTATSGTWTGTPTITHAYQWRRCNSSGAACVDVGTNATTYLLTAADVASTIRVAVTATNAAGPSLAATSAATTLVAAAPPVASTPLPAVTGTSARNEVLSTTSGTFTGTAPFTHTYQWQRCNAAGGACVSIAGATASSYTLVLADVTKTIRAQVTAHSTLIVASAVATSAASAVIADVVIPPSETTAVVIGGLAEQHTTLTLTPAVFAGTGPITHAYQWQRCDSLGTGCVNVTDASDPSGLTWTLDAADVGSTLRVIDTGTNSAGSAPSTSAPTDVVIETVPAANTEAPAITGQLEEGVTISTTGGVWAGTPVPNVSVAWYRCNVDGSACAAISGANDVSYTLVAADVTFALQVRAVGSNTYGTDTASSAISSEVAPARIPVNSGSLPSVSSQSTIPETTQDLSVADGTWTGTEATKTYQWKRCDQYGEACAPIAGQTETTYHLVHPTDAGSTFRAEVTYTNVAGTDMAESPATPVVVAATPPATSDPLVIEQDANATINIVTAPVWTGTETITYEYEWMLCYSATETDPSQCDSHAGPDGNSSYTTTSADFQDVPAWLMLRIWATNLIEPDGVSSELSNGISLPVWCEACPGTCLCSNISPPVITGDAIFPGTLSGSDGEWTGSLALTYLYQWQRCDGSGANCVDLPGATSSTYETAFLDVGNTLVFQVIARASTGDSAPAYSAPSGVVVAATAPVPDEVPVITGADATIGTTLSVSDGTWTGLPSNFSFAYQWERCSAIGDNCTDIPDATGNSHTLAQGDLGLTVRARVTATNVAGSDTATAAAFPDSPDVVIQATDPDAPPAAELRITNTTAADADPDNPAAPFEGHTLSVDAGAWGGTPTVQFAYQWQLCDATGGACVDLALETGSTHEIGEDEVGGTLRVIVVGTNPGLNSDTVTTDQFPNIGDVVLAAVAPSLSTTISVDDNPERTKVSNADPGSWTGTEPMSTTQQWQRCADAVDVLTCEDITGETLTQYTPTAVDVNDPGTPYFLRLVVTSTNAGGSMIEASPISVNAVGPGIVPTNDVVPSVAGPYAVGTTLTADPGTWSGTVELTYTYQWRRCDPVCHDLPAETQESYMPTVEDEGHQLVVEVTGHNLVGVSAPVASAPVGPVTP